MSIFNVNPLRLLCFALATSNCVLAADSRETFDQSTQLPRGWQSGITGQGSAKWEVVPEQSAPSKPNVLRQSGEATFAWAAKMDTAIKDGFVQVKINPIGGHEDQARSEEHTSELQSHSDLVCRLLLEKKKKQKRKSPNSN